MSAPNSFALSKSVDVIMIFKIIKGAFCCQVPRARLPDSLIYTNNFSAKLENFNVWTYIGRIDFCVLV